MAVKTFTDDPLRIKKEVDEIFNNKLKCSKTIGQDEIILTENAEEIEDVKPDLSCLDPLDVSNCKLEDGINRILSVPLPMKDEPGSPVKDQVINNSNASCINGAEKEVPYVKTEVESDNCSSNRQNTSGIVGNKDHDDLNTDRISSNCEIANSNHVPLEKTHQGQRAINNDNSKDMDLEPDCNSPTNSQRTRQSQRKINDDNSKDMDLEPDCNSPTNSQRTRQSQRKINDDKSNDMALEPDCNSPTNSQHAPQSKSEINGDNSKDMDLEPDYNTPKKSLRISQRKRKLNNDNSEEIDINSDHATLKKSHCTPRKKRKINDDNSNNVDIDSDCATPNTKRRVRFASGDSIKSTRVYEKSSKPLCFTPSSKVPGVGILKNKNANSQANGVKTPNSEAVVTGKQNKKKKTIASNRKEGKKIKKPEVSGALKSKDEKITLETNTIHHKEQSPNKRKRDRSCKNTEIKNNSKITDFFHKINGDDDKTKESNLNKNVNTDENLKKNHNADESFKTSDSTDETVNVGNLENSTDNRSKVCTDKNTFLPMIGRKKKKKKKLEDSNINSFLKHCQKSKSKKLYKFKCPVLAYLCICSKWCKSGPELNEHLSICKMLQPRVVLTKLSS